MEKHEIKIVADSSSDITYLSDVPFESVPLKIITAHKEYIDDANLDVCGMANDLLNYKGKSSTSCPNVNDWLNAFGETKWIFCITITGTLSGSYNAAMTAKSVYEEAHPDRRVFVLNSLSAGPEISLVIEKMQELILEEKSFDEICENIKKYSQRTGLLFMLESMKNLANNGRVSPLVAKMAGILGIRVVGKASERGDLEALNKCRGERRALETIVQYLKSLGYNGRKIRIAHCFNESASQSLKDLIQKEIPTSEIKIHECRGLCSFYAEKGGLLIGFEKEKAY